MDDAEAFRAFARARTPSLYRAAWLLCGDPHTAEDLVQDTLTKVYLAWGRTVIDNPAGYARTTLVRTYISSRRLRSSTERRMAAVPEVTTQDPDLATRLDLQQALRQLGPLDRAVLVLRFFEDRTVADTAAALSMSPGAVRTRTHRALVRIRALLPADLASAELTSATGTSGDMP